LPPEYQIRALNSGDVPAVLELLAGTLGADIPRTLEFWKWKHEQNPFGASPAVVAESNGRLVGLRTFLRWQWQSRSQTFNAARAVDTATHREWRGKGMFQHLTTKLLVELEEQGIEFVFNTPNRYSLPGYLKMGWKPVTRLPIWILPLHLFGRFQRSRPAMQAKSAASVLQEPAVHAFLEHGWSDYRAHTARTLAYLQWRYAEIPGFNYSGDFISKNGEAALLFYRIRSRKNLTELSISEIVASNSQGGIYLGRKLLAHILNSANARYAVALAAEDTPEQQIIKDAGFFPTDHWGPVLTARLLSHHPTVDPLNWSNWRCSIGDLELF